MVRWQQPRLRENDQDKSRCLSLILRGMSAGPSVLNLKFAGSERRPSDSSYRRRPVSTAGWTPAFAGVTKKGDAANFRIRTLDLSRRYSFGGRQVHDANIVATMLVHGER